MFTFLILLVMHVIFQTLEWWTGISSKGGPTNQTQCDFGFISLLKHLVLFSARQERGGKHAKTLIALSLSAIMLWNLLPPVEKWSNFHNSYIFQDSFSCPRAWRLCIWPAFLNSRPGFLSWTRKVEMQVTGVCGDRISLHAVTLNVMALRVLWTTTTSQIRQPHRGTSSSQES